MKSNLEILNETLSMLNADEQQILKDAINYGLWGDAEVDFKAPDAANDAFGMGFCTNDAAMAGHFEGRRRSSLFRSIYKKLGILGHGCGSNEYFFYCNDWWGDGTGDMFFIRCRRDDMNTRLDAIFSAWAQDLSIV